MKKLIHSLLTAVAVTLLCSSCNNISSDEAVSATTGEEKDIAGTLLLKDFRPQSIYNIQKTHVVKAAFPIIDMHAHAYAQDQEGLERWVETMDAAGIEKTIVMTQKCGPDFDSIHAFYAQYPERFDVWCSFDYTGFDQEGYGPEAIAELERCVKLGAKGVGELGDKGKGLFYANTGPAPGMHSDDPRLDPLFDKCAELDLPVNLHMADPKWMYETMDSTNDGMMNSLRWRLDNKEGIIGHAGMMEKLENTLKRHPNTTFIICHLANCTHDLSIVADLLDKYPNMYSDFSARFCYLAAIPRTAGAFFEKYQDRLLYGTDWGTGQNMYQLTYRILETNDEHFYGYEYDFNSYHWPLHGLDLSNEVLEKIYSGNAKTIYAGN